MTVFSTSSFARTVVGLTGTAVFASICLLSATAPAQAASFQSPAAIVAVK